MRSYPVCVIHPVAGRPQIWSAASPRYRNEGLGPDSFRGARETGNEQSVQVRYDEGVAIHIGPEPCVAVRKGGGEASVGERIGQPLSLVKISYPGRRRRCEGGRQHVRARQRERPDGPAWSKNLACADARCAGTGAPPARPVATKSPGSHREGEEP